jgi:hypothetical protein
MAIELHGIVENDERKLKSLFVVAMSIQDMETVY